MLRNTYAALLVAELNLVATKPDRNQLLKNLERQIKEKEMARKAQKQENVSQKAPAQPAFQAKSQQNRQVHQPGGANGHQNRGMGRKI